MFNNFVVLRLLFLLLVVAVPCKVIAQIPTYKMPSNIDTTVYDCKGIFTDSDAGPNTNYLAQAQDTFRICTGGTITLSFTSFQLEFGSDTLFFYNGNTISSGTLIGAFTGNTMPTGIVANDCLTILFKSDFFLQDIGWSAQWTSTVVPPVPPTISINPVPSCNTTTVDVALSKNIHCDSAYAAAFEVTGPIATTVSNATALACVGDSTTAVRLTLNTSLDESCTYNVNFTINMLDRCDSLWTFIESNSFVINDCPLTVSITPTPNDTICVGACAQLTAELNSCLSYNYYWSHGLPNTATHNVCPASTTTYTLGVQSTLGGPTYTTSIQIVVENPVITPPASNPVCQSVASFNLVANPPGGIWTGQGVTDTVLGFFDPDTAGAGAHTLRYTVNGCSSTFVMNVTEMDAGFDEAACTGSPAFQLTGNTPAGGTWSGYAGLTAGGIFDPTSLGTYTVTYTHGNGCSDQKQVFVAPLAISPLTDTVCESVPSYTLTASPPGGRWQPVAGITDTLNGVIDPEDAGPGYHAFIYVLNGCSDTAHTFIKEIDGGSNIVKCPAQTTFTITQAAPSGGLWTSAGTNNAGASGLLTAQGAYNPNIQGILNFTDTLIYTASNGCTDSVNLYTRLTNINDDSLFYCTSDAAFELTYGSTKRSPGGGDWSGTGVSVNSGDYYYNPATAGVGVHTLTYLANTCSDTVRMVVHPSSLAYDDTTVCTSHPAFVLDPIGVNALWQGQGITNSQTGLFDPSVSGVGTFPIVYSTDGGCSDTINVTVYQFQAATISGIDTLYCYNNQNHTIGLSPAGGTLSGTGFVGTTFNPSVAGEGTYTMRYEFGSGPCYTVDSITVVVYPAIQTTVTITNNPICQNFGSTINVATEGGNPTTGVSLNWSNNLFPTNTNVVSPLVSTTYTITAYDGCSESVVDTARIIIHPKFDVTFTTSSIACDGVPGTATANVTGSNPYLYSWSANASGTGNTISGLSGASYNVTVTDSVTGCSKDTSVTIPGHGLINALFSVNPDLPCIPLAQNNVTFIDLSLGATQGYWELSDGTRIPYVNGTNPSSVISTPGNYSMLLHVENDGNCVSEASISLCIQEDINIFVPDIFSPNNDGENDVFYVRATGTRKLLFRVYDRWGRMVFETTDPTIGWDGFIKGKKAVAGVYVWTLDATMFDDTEVIKKGNVSLVR